MKKNLKVCCCIIRKDLKTLILKRNSKGPRDGLWEFPGGKIEKGESEHSCVIREVKEEIGLSLKNINFFTRTKHEYDDINVELIGFIAESHIISKPNLIVHSDYKWIKNSEFEKYAFPEANIKIIDELIESEKYFPEILSRIEIDYDSIYGYDLPLIHSSVDEIQKFLLTKNLKYLIKAIEIKPQIYIDESIDLNEIFYKIKPNQTLLNSMEKKYINEKRLDSYLVEKNFFESRAKAQVHILAGEVYVNNEKVLVPSKLIREPCDIEIKFLSDNYVSRSGIKLKSALDNFNVSANDKVCIDVGASTGGFTECLLRDGAKKVYSVDVGYGQLDYKLRSNDRVINLEKTNARYLTTKEIPDSIELIVMDVSFISITKFDSFLKSFTNNQIEFVGLIKPQFELNREKIGKKGIVTNENFRIEANLKVSSFLSNYFKNVSEVISSPIKGAKGNIESLIYCSNL